MCRALYLWGLDLVWDRDRAWSGVEDPGLVWDRDTGLARPSLGRGPGLVRDKDPGPGKGLPGP